MVPKQLMYMYIWNSWQSHWVHAQHKSNQHTVKKHSYTTQINHSNLPRDGALYHQDILWMIMPIDHRGLQKNLQTWSRLNECAYASSALFRFTIVMKISYLNNILRSSESIQKVKKNGASPKMRSTKLVVCFFWGWNPVHISTQDTWIPLVVIIFLCCLEIHSQAEKCQSSPVHSNAIVCHLLYF